MLDLDKVVISFEDSDSENEEILRNLKTLYTTPTGTIPLDRNFGLEQDFISYPLDVAQNMYTLEITEKTEMYEPRVEIKDISFTNNTDGGLIPVIRVGRADIDEDREDEE